MNSEKSLFPGDLKETHLPSKSQLPTKEERKGLSSLLIHLCPKPSAAQGQGESQALGPERLPEGSAPCLKAWGTTEKMELQRPKTTAELRVSDPLRQGRVGLEKWRGTDLTGSE